MAAEPAPEPRAVFVAQLEDRLAELIRRSADGDLVPEVELSARSVGRATHPAATAAVAVLAALVVLLTTVAMRGPMSPGAGLAIAGNDAGRPLRDSAAATEPGSRPVRDAAVAAEPEGAPDGSAPSSGGAPHGPCDGPTCAGAVRDGADGASPAPAGALASTPWPVGPAPGPPEVAAAPPPHEPALGPTGGQAVAGAAGPARLDLRAVAGPALVSIEWSRYDGDDFAAYLLLRADGAEAPHAGVLGALLLLLRVENREMTNHLDLPRLGSSPRYRVVAVRGDGSIAAESAVVSATALAADARPGSAYPAIS